MMDQRRRPEVEAAARMAAKEASEGDWDGVMPIVSRSVRMALGFREDAPGAASKPKPKPKTKIVCSVSVLPPGTRSGRMYGRPAYVDGQQRNDN